MSYTRTSFGPGNIGNLTSGIGLTYGPTIGSNDQRAQLSGLGGLGKLAVSSPLRVSVRTEGVTKIGTIGTLAPARILPAESDTLVAPGEELPAYTEEPVVTEPTGMPAWVWVAGGLGLFAAIGGIVWYALK